MNYNTLNWTVADGILTLTLNRPERHHALSAALTGELEGALERAEADPETRVIVVAGSGPKAFCACGDLLDMRAVEQPVRRFGHAAGPTGVRTHPPRPVTAATSSASGVRITCRTTWWSIRRAAR